MYYIFFLRPTNVNFGTTFAKSLYIKQRYGMYCLWHWGCLSFFPYMYCFRVLEAFLVLCKFLDRSEHITLCTSLMTHFVYCITFARFWRPFWGVKGSRFRWHLKGVAGALGLVKRCCFKTRDPGTPAPYSGASHYCAFLNRACDRMVLLKLNIKFNHFV